MAGLSPHGSGYRITWREPKPDNPTGPKVVRRVVYVAGTEQAATTVKQHIEALLDARAAGISARATTIAWAGSLTGAIRASLERAGLVDQETRRRTCGSITLREGLEAVIDARESDWSDAATTRDNWEQASRWFLKYFPDDRTVQSITPGDISQWRRWMSKSLAPTTAGKHLKRLRTAFEWFVKQGWVRENPCSDEKIPAEVSKQNVYIEQSDFEAVLQEVPCREWRALLVLGRYLGIRVPSEALGMTWADVSWGPGTPSILIRSPKTAYLGRAERLAPLFPEVRLALEALWEQASPGAVWIFPRLRLAGGSTNLRTQLRRFCARAGVEPWTRPFVSMRASAATDLVDAGYPDHVRTTWLGHSVLIAQRHYLRVTREHWERAVSGYKSGYNLAEKCLPEGDNPGTVADCQESPNPIKTRA